jgi:hypothetical protein
MVVCPVVGNRLLKKAKSCANVRDAIRVLPHSNGEDEAATTIVILFRKQQVVGSSPTIGSKNPPSERGRLKRPPRFVLPRPVKWSVTLILA